jgi:hypothetical protein
MSTSQVFNSILTQLESNVTSATIVRSAMEGDELAASSSGLFPPYAVVTFGGPIETSRGRNLVNRRMNLLRSWVVVTAVAPVDSDAMKVKDEVISALWGFSPTDGGEMVMTGGTAQSVTSEQTRPHKYIHTIMFEVPHNLTSW